MVPLDQAKFAANLGGAEPRQKAELGVSPAKTGFDSFVETQLNTGKRRSKEEERKRRRGDGWENERIAESPLTEGELQDRWRGLGVDEKQGFDRQANAFNARLGLPETSSYSADPKARRKEVEADVYRNKDGFTTRPVEGSADDIGRSSNFQALLDTPQAGAGADKPAISDFDGEMVGKWGKVREGSPQAHFEKRVATGKPLSDEEIAQAGRYAAKLGTTFDPEDGYDRRPYLAQEGNRRMGEVATKNRPSDEKAENWATERGMSFMPEKGFAAKLSTPQPKKPDAVVTRREDNKKKAKPGGYGGV